MAGGKKTRMAEDQFGRQPTLADRPARTVEIGQQGVQQARALFHAGRQRSPFLAGHQ